MCPVVIYFLLRAGAWHARSWIRPWAYYRTWRTRAADLSLGGQGACGARADRLVLGTGEGRTFQIGQVDVAYVGETATDGTHTCELYV